MCRVSTVVVVGEDRIEEVIGADLEVEEVTAPTERVEGKPGRFLNVRQFSHARCSQRQSAWFLINKKTGVRNSLSE